jgi:hypothetical protein
MPFQAWAWHPSCLIGRDVDTQLQLLVYLVQAMCIGRQACRTHPGAAQLYGRLAEGNFSEFPQLLPVLHKTLKTIHAHGAARL